MVYEMLTGYPPFDYDEDNSKKSGGDGTGTEGGEKRLFAKIMTTEVEYPDNMSLAAASVVMEVARLIGAPPGYDGHDAGGQLTNRLKKFPNAVVLLDQVDEAHPDVLDVLLQLYDEGRLTDGQGATIQCNRAIFIMTSNLASEKIIDYVEKKRLEDVDAVPQKVTFSEDFRRGVVLPLLKNFFRGYEFLARIDKMVYFAPFSESGVIQLVSRELTSSAQQALEVHKVNLFWHRSVLAVLADGYQVYSGARSIRVEVRDRVLSRVCEAKESGIIREGSTVRLSVLSIVGTGNGAAIRFQFKKDKIYVDIKDKDVEYPLLS